MKVAKLILGIAVVLVLASLPFTAWAVPYQQIPNPRQMSQGWVSDTAEILSPATENQLNQIISGLETKNGSEIAVVTVPDTSPSTSPKAFATSLFNFWGIGKKGLENGLLFLISVNDHRVEIETGRGIQANLPDVKVQRIIDQQILPTFKGMDDNLRKNGLNRDKVHHDYDQGTIRGTQAIVTQLESASFVPIHTNNWAWIPFVLVLGLLGQGILSLGKKKGISLQPSLRSRVSSEAYMTDSCQAVICAECPKYLLKMTQEQLSAHLTPTEKVAQTLGSLKFAGWQCPNSCQKEGADGIHIRAYLWRPDSFRTCPNCQELTVKYCSEVLEKATLDQQGTVHIVEQCACCDYGKEYDETVPHLKSTQFHNTSGDSGSEYSGGGDFGGGSGGGGAGGSW